MGYLEKIKCISYHTQHHHEKNNPRQIQDLNVARQNHKIPDENIGGKILYVDLSNICLHLTLKVITSKIKINK